MRHLGEKIWKRLSLANLDFEILGFLCLQKPFWGQRVEIQKINLRESQALYCYNCHWQFNTMNILLCYWFVSSFWTIWCRGYSRITHLNEKELDLESWCGVCSYVLGTMCRHRYLGKSDASVEAGEHLVLSRNRVAFYYVGVARALWVSGFHGLGCLKWTASADSSNRSIFKNTSMETFSAVLFPWYFPWYMLHLYTKVFASPCEEN